MKDAEATIAVNLSNRILDTPYKDPDDDESVLARQFLRAMERIAALAAATAERDTARDDGRRVGLAEAAEIAKRSSVWNTGYAIEAKHEGAKAMKERILAAIRDRLAGVGATEGTK